MATSILFLITNFLLYLTFADSKILYYYFKVVHTQYLIIVLSLSKGDSIFYSLLKGLPRVNKLGVFKTYGEDQPDFVQSAMMETFNEELKEKIVNKVSIYKN